MAFDDFDFDFSKMRNDFAKTIRSTEKEWAGLDRKSSSLIEASFKKLVNEAKIAKDYRENVHQKIQVDKAELARMQEEIYRRQREIDLKREIKSQKRRFVKRTRESAAEKKTHSETALDCLQKINKTIDDGLLAVTKNREKRVSLMQLYREHTGLVMTVASATEITFSFTRIAPMDLNLVHEVALKQQRSGSAYKVSTKPPIKISKVQLDDLNKKDQSWKEFVVYVRQQFASLYEG